MQADVVSNVLNLILAEYLEFMRRASIHPALIAQGEPLVRDVFSRFLHEAVARKNQLPPELWGTRRRTDANLAAMRVLARGGPQTEADWTALAQYSGWGGLSLTAVQDKVPQGLPMPDERGLIHEYYTPTAVATSIARIVAPLLPSLPRMEGADEPTLAALEPSAGIGRLMRAVQPHSSVSVQWSAIEYSQLSAAVLQWLVQRLGPKIRCTVEHSSFEAFVARRAQNQLQSTYGLVLANPPYGQRGEASQLDPDKRWRKEPRAYIYFLQRALEMLTPGGLGVFLVPAAFLASRSANANQIRDHFLRQFHLSSAYRLPNEPNLIPGTMVIVDVLFWRHRGQPLSAPLKADAEIIEGRYFSHEAPHHVLGQEEGAPNDGDGARTTDRYNHTVRGQFAGLPALVERPWELRSVTARPSSLKKGITGSPVKGQEEAAELGRRLEEYTQALAQEQTRRARALHTELVEALRGWRKLYGSPHLVLRDSARAGTDETVRHVQRMRGAFTPEGELLPELLRAPVYEPRFQGDGRNVVAVAEWYYAQHGTLSIDSLFELCQRLGHPWDGDLLPLLNAQWCIDGDGWDELVPANVYYSGAVREKLLRAESQLHDPQATKQRQRLRALLNEKRYAEIKPLRITDPWLPLEVLEAFVASKMHLTVKLTRQHGGLIFVSSVAKSYAYQSTMELDLLIGAVNSDYIAFDPHSWPDDATLDWRVRRNLLDENSKAQRCTAYIERWNEQLEAFLDSGPVYQTLLEERYNEQFCSFIPPEYSNAPLSIERWKGQIKLHAHQAAGARRILANRRGVLAFDVGVGKTYTGLAVMARAREEGWVRRPVIVVPNTIVWKWYADISRALPDYRVGVIGSKRIPVRPNVLTRRLRLTHADALSRYDATGRRSPVERYILSVLKTEPSLLSDVMDVRDSDRTRLEELIDAGYIQIDGPNELQYRVVADTEADRTATWQRFALGGYDCIVVPYSRFGSIQMRPDRHEQLLKQCTAVEAMLYRKTSDRSGRYEPLSERQRAAQNEAIAKKLAELTALGEKPETVYWEDLGCDFLMVDEAQNFKNWWLPEPAPGGSPKYMGNAGIGSERAWDLAAKTMDVRERTGNAGVVLLSATPMKNSPLEIYNMISYVAPDLWESYGIHTPAQFVAAFCKIELIAAPNAVGIVEQNKPACTGFTNYQLLKEAIFRVCDIKTAEMVHLKLPQPIIRLVELDMNLEQQTKYQRYLSQVMAEQEKLLREIRQIEKPEKKFILIELLVKMSQVAVHPALDEYPTWDSALNYPVDSPKITECAQRIMANLYQHTMYGPATVHEALMTSEPVRLLRGQYAVVAQGEAHHEGSTITLLRRENEMWQAVASQRADSGQFSLTLANGELEEGDYCLQLLNVRSVTVTASSPHTAELACATPQTSCRCGHIVFCDSVVVHRWLAEVLVDLGMPRDRIAMLNAEVAPKPATRTKIAADFNGNKETGVPPLYDVVICNAVAYEGIDLQTRTCAIHHLDFPWEPATLSQRNGRGVRQGNQLNAIEIIYYLSKKSADGIRFNLIMGKRNWMTKLLSSMDREISNPAAQQDFDLSDLLLLASTDPDKTKTLLEQMRYRQQNEELYLRREVLAAKLLELRRQFSSPDDIDAASRDLLNRYASEAEWRWLHTMPLLWRVESDEESTPILRLHLNLPILYPGMRLRLRPKGAEPVMIEVLSAQEYRQYGRVLVEKDSETKLLTDHAAGITDDDLNPHQWDDVKDAQLTRLDGEQLIEEIIKEGGWEAVLKRLPLLRRFWPLLSDAVRESLSDPEVNQKSKNMVVPTFSSERTVVLVPAFELATRTRREKLELIPPTHSGLRAMVHVLRRMNDDTAVAQKEQEQQTQRILRAGSLWFGVRLTQAMVLHLETSGVSEDTPVPRQERREVVLPVYRAVPPVARLVPTSRKQTKANWKQ